MVGDKNVQVFSVLKSVYDIGDGCFKTSYSRNKVQTGKV